MFVFGESITKRVHNLTGKVRTGMYACARFLRFLINTILSRGRVHTIRDRVTKFKIQVV